MPMNRRQGAVSALNNLLSCLSSLKESFSFDPATGWLVPIEDWCLRYSGGQWGSWRLAPKKLLS